MALKETVDEYIAKVDSIYGLYLDSVYSYRILKAKMRELNEGESDTFPITVMNDNPDYPETRALHHTTLGQLLQRLSADGEDSRAIGNSSLVMIYQLWEDEYRNRIAVDLGKEKNEIRSDLFGDIRIVRQGIVHNNGKKTQDIRKLKIMELMEGENIHLSEKQFEKLINDIKVDLKKIGVQN